MVPARILGPWEAIYHDLCPPYIFEISFGSLVLLHSQGQQTLPIMSFIRVGDLNQLKETRAYTEVIASLNLFKSSCLTPIILNTWTPSAAYMQRVTRPVMATVIAPDFMWQPHLSPEPNWLVLEQLSLSEFIWICPYLPNGSADTY